MKKFTTWFLILAKRQLTSPLFIALILIFPIAVFAISRIPVDENSGKYTVGLYIENNSEDAFANSLVDSLTSAEDFVDFIRYTDRQSMEEDIINEHLVCGYVIPDNLPERLHFLDITECITTLSLPSSTLQFSINELVYASLIKYHGYNILDNYLRVSQNFPKGDYQAEVFERYEHYVNGERLLQINLQICASNGTLQPGKLTTSFDFPIRGVLAIMIFLAGLFGCVLWQKDNEAGIFQTVTGNYRHITKLVYIVIPTLFFALSSFVTLMLSGTSASLGKEAGGMVIYVLAILIFDLILLGITRTSKTMSACIPILLLCCIVFCPIFIDVGMYFAPARHIQKIFLPYHYMNFFL